MKLGFEFPFQMKGDKMFQQANSSLSSYQVDLYESSVCLIQKLYHFQLVSQISLSFYFLPSFLFFCILKNAKFNSCQAYIKGLLLISNELIWQNKVFNCKIHSNSFLTIIIDDQSGKKVLVIEEGLFRRSFIFNTKTGLKECGRQTIKSSYKNDIKVNNNYCFSIVTIYAGENQPKYLRTIAPQKFISSWCGGLEKMAVVQ